MLWSNPLDNKKENTNGDSHLSSPKRSQRSLQNQYLREVKIYISVFVSSFVACIYAHYFVDVKRNQTY